MEATHLWVWLCLLLKMQTMRRYDDRLARACHHQSKLWQENWGRETSYRIGMCGVMMTVAIKPRLMQVVEHITLATRKVQFGSQCPSVSATVQMQLEAGCDTIG